MRLALAILIAVTQTAGPWLCCCGAERLTAALATRPSEAKPAPAKAPACHHTCPHCATPQDEPPAPPPDHKPPIPERCPCGCVELVAVLTTKTDGADPTAAGLIPVTPAVPEAVAVGSHSPAEWAGRRAVPHLTTDDRLYAHHVLRC